MHLETLKINMHLATVRMRGTYGEQFPKHLTLEPLFKDLLTEPWLENSAYTLSATLRSQRVFPGLFLRWEGTGVRHLPSGSYLILTDLRTHFPYRKQRFRDVLTIICPMLPH